MPYLPVLSNIIGIGNMAVDVFFFFSGLCLSLSAAKHQYLQIGWREFFKRRFNRIIIPYLIICVPYYAWNAICETGRGALHKAIVFGANLSSVSFWLRGTQTTWYVYGIAFFYLLFPLLYRVSVKLDRKKRLCILGGMIGVAILSAYVPILKNSMIVWARLPVFTVGMFVGIGQEKMKKIRMADTAVSILVLIALGWVTSASEISETFTIPQVYRFLLYLPMTIALLTILSKIGIKSNAFAWIGGLSLEVYLIHITLLHPVKYYGIMESVGYWLYILLPVLTLCLALPVGRIEKLILGKMDDRG